jgi:hypothetical protein
VTTIVQRFARVTQPSIAKVAGAAGLSVLGLALSDDWGAAVESIARKIDAAETKRADLSSQRSELLLGSDETALTRVENEIAAIDRELFRLRDARDLAAERAKRQAEAEAREAYGRALVAWEAGNAEMSELAEETGALLAKAAARCVELTEMAERQAKTCPVELPGYSDVRPLGAGRTVTALQTLFAKAGVSWARHGIIVPWQAVPSLGETIKDGIEWARAEVQRAEHRKNVT